MENFVLKIGNLRLQLIDEWKKFYTMYSIWFFAALGSFGDIYNLAVSFDLLSGEMAPQKLVYGLNIVAFFGAFSRLVKQKKLDIERDRVQHERSGPDPQA